MILYLLIASLVLSNKIDTEKINLQIERTLELNSALTLE